MHTTVEKCEVRDNLFSFFFFLEEVPFKLPKAAWIWSKTIVKTVMLLKIITFSFIIILLLLIKYIYFTISYDENNDAAYYFCGIWNRNVLFPKSITDTFINWMHPCCTRVWNLNIVNYFFIYLFLVFIYK